MPTNDERGIVSKSKLTALATSIKTKGAVTGGKTLDELKSVVDGLDTSGVHPTGSLQISSNGTVDVTQYAEAIVNVPSSASGSISISENGTFDVSSYAQAVVAVVNVLQFTPFKIYDGFYTPTSSLSSIAITIPNETTVSHILFGAIWIPDYNSYVDGDHVGKLLTLQISDAKYPVAGGWTSTMYNLCVKSSGTSAYIGYNTQNGSPTYSGAQVTCSLKSCTTIPNVQMRVFFVYV